MVHEKRPSLAGNEPQLRGVVTDSQAETPDTTSGESRHLDDDLAAKPARSIAYGEIRIAAGIVTGITR